MSGVRRLALKWRCKLCLTGTRYIPAQHWPGVVFEHLRDRHGV